LVTSEGSEFQAELRIGRHDYYYKEAGLQLIIHSVGIKPLFLVGPPPKFDNLVALKNTNKSKTEHSSSLFSDDPHTLSHMRINNA